MTKAPLFMFALGAALALALPAGEAKDKPTQSFDLRHDTVEASVVRGSIVFKTYCVLCHGVNGEGNGRAAASYSPPPANLARSELSDAQKERMIRGGGQANGRSPFMPPWGQELTNEQIRDLVSYLRAINRGS